MDKSSKQVLIETHYANIADTLTWTADRLNRLCSAAQVTHEELATILRFPARQLHNAAAANRFPPTVELHLTLMEQFVFKELGRKQIFPNVLSHD